MCDIFVGFEMRVYMHHGQKHYMMHSLENQSFNGKCRFISQELSACNSQPHFLFFPSKLHLCLFKVALSSPKNLSYSNGFGLFSDSAPNHHTYNTYYTW